MSQILFHIDSLPQSMMLIQQIVLKIKDKIIRINIGHINSEVKSLTQEWCPSFK